VSLRARVALLILAMFVAGILVAIARTGQESRRKIQAELQADILPKLLLQSSPRLKVVAELDSGEAIN